MTNTRTQMTKWKPDFYKTITYPIGVKVDMFIIRDCPTGENMVTLGVPHGRGDIATQVCEAMNAKQN